MRPDLAALFFLLGLLCGIALSGLCIWLASNLIGETEVAS